jgi:LysR family transcriptional regulator (chromosome initiation inhibitor)
MFDYPALAALAAVVREGSFERAARALHVSPSAISQRIRLLEERTGCALVVRGQPCTATEVGRRLCRHVDQVQLLEHELRGGLPALPEAAAAEAPRVSLPLAVNADSVATWFAPALAGWAAQAPVLVDIAVDDQDHTADWLRSGAVMAAVTGLARPVTGCNSLPLGTMRYRATASPGFVRRHFADGVGAASLARAPCLQFNPKDDLQHRWARTLCHRPVELPRHLLPSASGFVAAAVGGMGWGMNPDLLIAPHLQAGTLVELVPDTALDVPLYWQHARAAGPLLDGLTRHLMAQARQVLSPPTPAVAPGRGPRT